MGCASSGSSDDSPNQPDRDERIDKLSGDPFNPKPKTSTAVGPGELPVDLQWSTRASPNVNVDEAHGDRAPEPGTTPMRWYVTEALVKGHGRTMGCPRYGVPRRGAANRDGVALASARRKKARTYPGRCSGSSGGVGPGSGRKMVPGGQHVCQVARKGQGEVGARCGATPNGAGVEAPVEFNPGVRCCTRKFSSRTEGRPGCGRPGASFARG